MIKSAVTISLVPEARGGPFVFWDDLAEGCRKAAELGFDAVEVFPPSADAVDVKSLRAALDGHNLKLAAVGTGAGFVVQHLSLTHPKKSERRRALNFIRSVIDLAGSFGAPAIVGSMQGRWHDKMDRELAFGTLRAYLADLGEHARKYGVPLLYEPLNRYETNLCRTLAEGADLLQLVLRSNVNLLADLFHMNIEEADMSASIRAAGKLIGHVHFADSNRKPAGMGHTDFAPVVAALRDIGYEGYVSAECFPYPDPDAAARQTIESFRKFFR
jgi:sugar phosphate isomerase/epimerase